MFMRADMLRWLIIFLFSLLLVGDVDAWVHGKFVQPSGDQLVTGANDPLTTSGGDPLVTQ